MVSPSFLFSSLEIIKGAQDSHESTECCVILAFSHRNAAKKDVRLNFTALCSPRDVFLAPAVLLGHGAGGSVPPAQPALVQPGAWSQLQITAHFLQFISATRMMTQLRFERFSRVYWATKMTQLRYFRHLSKHKETRLTENSYISLQFISATRMMRRYTQQGFERLSWVHSEASVGWAEGGVVGPLVW